MFSFLHELIGKRKMIIKEHCCYILKSRNSRKTYVGYSNDPKKRLRRHNGELAGGARYTKTGRPWKHLIIIGGFVSKNKALSFEKRLKLTKGKNKVGIRGRAESLNLLMKKIIVKEYFGNMDNITLYDIDDEFGNLIDHTRFQ